MKSLLLSKRGTLASHSRFQPSTSAIIAVIEPEPEPQTDVTNVSKPEPQTFARSYRDYFFEGLYLKQKDVDSSYDSPHVWTISKVEPRKIGKLGKEKLVVFFEETKKGLILNRVNADKLCEITGYSQPEKWVGHRVGVYVNSGVTFKGKTVGGIRLRKPPPEY